MEKQIPIYFDSVVVSSPLERISEANQNLGRLKVRVFTKYGNRNGSYITDAVAQQLIDSATNGNTPVIGFFDPSTQTWASHTGPTLANAYGYVENFLGWEPFTDTDGIVREYAIFSVILFTKYFDEAQKILGQNQSMELNPETITGDWADIDGTEYYVYKTAEMLGFCIIGNHEPCFSVSSFFSKSDDTYNTQFEKFFSLLFDLKAQVEETKKEQEGGEQQMNEFENQEVVAAVEETPAVEESIEVFENTEEERVEETQNLEENIESESAEDEEQQEENQPSEYDLLQERFNALQTSYNDLEQNLNSANERIQELEGFNLSANAEIEELRNLNTELQASIAQYESQRAAAEHDRKNDLVGRYNNLLPEDEISGIINNIDNLTYEELESKLAITFANKQIAGIESHKVPLPEPEESQFALLMKKYKKK